MQATLCSLHNAGPLRLGDWRLADIDGNHFSVSCKTGQTSQVRAGIGFQGAL